MLEGYNFYAQKNWISKSTMGELTTIWVSDGLKENNMERRML